MVPANERLGRLLRERRKERIISLRQMADGAGVSPSVAFRAERGEELLLSTWERLFRALGCELLFDWVEDDEEAHDLLQHEKDQRYLRQIDGLLGL